MSIRALLLRARTKPVHGRPIRRPRHARVRRDPSRGRHSSDVVWALVEKMMAGDADAAAILNDVIEEGVRASGTHFVKTVTVSKGRGYSMRKVFDIERFNSKNYDLDVAAALKRNREWTD